MLSYVFFFIFFLFFSFKKLLYCCVLSTSVRYFYSSIAGEEKSAGKHLLVKMCQQQSGLTSFFSLCFWRQIQIDLFVLVYFCQFLSFFFFPTAITIMIRLFFADFFRIIYLFSFYYSLSDFGSFSSFSSESSALPLLDLLLSSVATAFLTE